MAENLNRQLRALVKPGAAMVVPGVANALTARIAEDLGFEAAYVTGAGVSNTFLGLPDLSFLTLTQLADHVAAIREVVGLPLIVDADTGFGNAVSVGHTVRVLERAGASCIQIEDQVFPKRCGHFDGKEVIEKAEFIAKIRAAVDARRDDDFMIIARTDAAACTSFEDAIDRAQAAREAGAHILFVEAPRSLDEIRRIPTTADAPFLINLVYGGNTPILGKQALSEMGYALVLYANAALQAAVAGMQRVLGHIHDTGSIDGVMEHAASFSERQRLVNKPVYDALEAKYAVG